MRQARRIALLLLFAFVVPLTALAADELLLSAKQHLEDGDPQAAYNLLIPLQSERAGDPEYDFLLGSAALGIGKTRRRCSPSSGSWRCFRTVHLPAP